MRLLIRSALPSLLAAVATSCAGATAPTPSVASGDAAGAGAGQAEVQAGPDAAITAKDAGGDAQTDAAKTDATKTDTAKTDAAKADTGKGDAVADNGITPAKVVCGDKFCAEGEEDCAICEYDCGPCAAVCGDSQCGTGENCTSCAKDCGGCPGVCGSGYCDPIEDCKSCPGDCGTCAPGCGNGACDKATETCDDCPLDCGKCSNEPCDPYTSKGCKEVEQCFPYSGGDLVCLGAGKYTLGQKCYPLVDCVKGLICINSTCTPICDATGKQPAYGCSGGKKCVAIGQSGKDSAGVGACL